MAGSPWPTGAYAGSTCSTADQTPLARSRARWATNVVWPRRSTQTTCTWPMEEIARDGASRGTPSAAVTGSGDDHAPPGSRRA